MVIIKEQRLYLIAHRFWDTCLYIQQSLLRCFLFSHQIQQYFFLFGITKQHIVVLIGCVSAVISGVVTQARYGERAEIHRSSGAQYANLARKIEVLQLKINAGIINNDNMGVQSSEIIAEWNDLSRNSLLTPHRESKSKLMLHVGVAIVFSLVFFIVAHT